MTSPSDLPASVPPAGPPGLADVLQALRQCCLQSGPFVVEHDWGHYVAYGSPQVFAFLWPQPTHVTLGLLQGARIRPCSRRLLGHGPALRTVLVRRAAEVDEELRELLRRAAALAMYSTRWR